MYTIFNSQTKIHTIGIQSSLILCSAKEHRLLHFGPLEISSEIAKLQECKRESAEPALPDAASARVQIAQQSSEDATTRLQRSTDIVLPAASESQDAPSTIQESLDSKHTTLENPDAITRVESSVDGIASKNADQPLNQILALFKNMSEGSGGDAFSALIKVMSLLISMVMKSFNRFGGTEEEHVSSLPGTTTRALSEAGKEDSTDTPLDTIQKKAEKIMAINKDIVAEREQPDSSTEQIYHPLYEDTLSVLDKKIAFSRNAATRAREEMKEAADGKALDYIFKLGGMLGKTLYESKRDEVLMIDDHVHELEAAKKRVVKINQHTTDSPLEKLAELQSIREKLGLPKLTKDQVNNPDTFRAMVSESLDKKTINLTWQNINATIADADRFMAGLETSVKGADALMAFLSSGVPGGDKVYSFTRNATAILTGEMTPQEAAQNFVLDLVIGKVGEKTFKLVGGQKMVTSWAHRYIPLFTGTDALKMQVDVVLRYAESTMTEVALKPIVEAAKPVLQSTA